MYNDTIKAENKIITSDDLSQIFQLMDEILKKYLKISEQEEIQNRNVDFQHQNYTFRNDASKMKFTVDFYDNATVTFDNYDNFMSVFYSRLDEIRSIDVHYTLSYTTISTEPFRNRKSYMQSINMYINEKKMEIVSNLSSEDPKLNEIYELIKSKILNAPEKYDEIVKKKNKITNTVAFAIGLIPAMILGIIVLFVPIVNNLFLKKLIVYPIFVAILSYLIGSVLSPLKLNKYYNPIMPEKKYAGYKDGHAVYKDDIDKFIGTSEILIGKKIKNMDNRKMIKLEYEKYKALLPIELIALLVISVIVIIIGLFI